MKLLSVGSDAKTVKGEKLGYMTGILYLAPHKESGVMNTCANATPSCIAACLFTAGRGTFSNVRNARIAKTVFFGKDQAGFFEQLSKDIVALTKKAVKASMTPCVRLNGTSDIPWEYFSVMQSFPEIQFYDYTKSYPRMMLFLAGEMPKNYHLTFSRTGDNDKAVAHVLENGGNVAAVFHTIPTEWNGYKVVNGDLSDLRFGDEHGVVVGLKAKGKARKDKTSGFVI